MQCAHRLNNLQAEVELDMALSQESEPLASEKPTPLEVVPCPVCWPANFLSVMVKRRDFSSAVIDGIL